jgi:hypothetical protein
MAGQMSLVCGDEKRAAEAHSHPQRERKREKERERKKERKKERNRRTHKAQSVTRGAVSHMAGQINLVCGASGPGFLPALAAAVVGTPRMTTLDEKRRAHAHTQRGT